MLDVPRVVLDRPATYEDLVTVPEVLVAEIVDGELWTSPRPAPRHAVAYARLVSLLEPPFGQGRGGPGGWIVLAEPELHLGNDVLVPDLAGWRRARMPQVPDTACFALAPDWACEILSPSTAVLDRTRKLRVYAREGVCHVWLVDPDTRTIEVLVLEASRWVVVDTYGADQAARIEPFDAVELELGVLWADAAPQR
jgi:Uma2 family endonuclease